MANSNRKYSVLMSVYYKENPEWFTYAIESMLNQTVFPDEFVLVEDGPLTDELYAVIDKYVAKYPKLFNIVKIEKNGGLGPALKLGVENCKNEMIARMDSDDWCEADRIDRQFQILETNPDLDIIGSNTAEFIDNVNNITGYVILPEKHEEIVKYSKRRCPFRHNALLYKKSAILKAGNYREFYLCEDYDLYTRMISTGALCYNAQDILVYTRISEDFFKRRGGIKYLKSILRFKKEQLKTGYFSLGDFLKSSIPHIIVCLIPNSLRDYIYRNLLRKKVK